jgi:hypothetical protein
MPDGQWLPETIAKQIYEGKRFDGQLPDLPNIQIVIPTPGRFGKEQQQDPNYHSTRGDHNLLTRHNRRPFPECPTMSRHYQRRSSKKLLSDIRHATL